MKACRVVPLLTLFVLLAAGCQSSPPTPPPPRQHPTFDHNPFPTSPAPAPTATPVLPARHADKGAHIHPLFRHACRSPVRRLERCQRQYLV